MAAVPPRGGREPTERADHPGTASRHDASGRVSGTPYVPAGRDDTGHPSPPVPHEGFLGRLATALLLGQSGVLAVVAVWAFVATATSSTGGPADVLALLISLPHAAVLAVTAVLGAAACLARRWGRRWTVTQFVVYLVVFFAGMTVGANQPQPAWLALDAQDHFLHLTLALLGFVTAMLFSARLVEPPADPPAHPTGRTDAPRPRSSSATRTASRTPGGSARGDAAPRVPGGLRRTTVRDPS